jgi:hypothetical protein
MFDASCSSSHASIEALWAEAMSEKKKKKKKLFVGTRKLNFYFLLYNY